MDIELLDGSNIVKKMPIDDIGIMRREMEKHSFKNLKLVLCK